MSKTRSAYVSKMPLVFDDETVHINEKDGATRYRKCSITAPWGIVNQIVREDRLTDKKGQALFAAEQAAA